MSLVLIGIFVSGLSASAAAAFYVPKTKSEWRKSDAPKVKTVIKLGEDK